MAGIPDRNYNAACGRLATRLGISQSAARRKVEIRAAQEGTRDSAAREALAILMLEEANTAGVDNGPLLNDLLEAVGNDVNFMLED
ncbi:MAG: hypothetical protein WCL59_09545 [Cyanobium sp. ELA507]|jgi:hypothetical protein